MSNKDKAADYFARHKESQECHITSDGRVFHSIGTAKGFANTLKDDTVKSYTRAEVAQPTKIVVQNTESEDEGLGNKGSEDKGSEDKGSEDNGSEDKGSEDEGSEDEEKVQALDALKNFDASVAQYSEIKALVKALGLDTENQKQDTLIAALEAYKVIINTEVQE
ncbi:hypothetical protein [Flavobacterium sp. UMI-01]|uniref:hypothetical protein n=1 Tax=Flavobacterium sp. UMI-01 TaxID=1441053 RepID=UPI001C7D479A|nr:hypothetical protein [Flavobacterium sp. UMI-01]GIZ10282.1 hypothetical protein FUMI01_30060 [Flavobacterium sp. UMI-01]